MLSREVPAFAAAVRSVGAQLSAAGLQTADDEVECALRLQLSEVAHLLDLDEGGALRSAYHLVIEQTVSTISARRSPR